MAISDQLAEMSKRAKAVEDKAAASQKETREQLDAAVAKAKADAQTRQEKAKARKAQVQGDLSAGWATMQAQVRDQFDQMQTSIDEKLDKHDVKVAQRRADWAEGNAAEAIDFAVYSIDLAEQWVLYAIDARLASEHLAHPVA